MKQLDVERSRVVVPPTVAAMVTTFCTLAWNVGFVRVLFVSVTVALFFVASDVLSTFHRARSALSIATDTSSEAHVPALVLPLYVFVAMLASFEFVTVDGSIVHIVPLALTVMSHLSPSVTPGVAISPDPSTLAPLTVLMLVPDTSVSCLLVASPEYCVFVALSPVFDPLVLARRALISIV